MEDIKVKIKSMVDGKVVIDLLDPRIKRLWEHKGVVRIIKFEDLEQAMYNSGVEYMFTQGILDIVNDNSMEIKIALGLEPEDAKEPVNTIVLDDAKKRRYLTVAPIQELKELLSKISYEQAQELADFAIKNELGDFDRSEVIKKAVQIDIMKAIQLKRSAEEK